jgi:hypothetical protein
VACCISPRPLIRTGPTVTNRFDLSFPHSAKPPSYPPKLRKLHLISVSARGESHRTGGRRDPSLSNRASERRAVRPMSPGSATRLDCQCCRLCLRPKHQVYLEHTPPSIRSKVFRRGSAGGRRTGPPWRDIRAINPTNRTAGYRRRIVSIALTQFWCSFYSAPISMA